MAGRFRGGHPHAGGAGKAEASHPQGTTCREARRLRGPRGRTADGESSKERSLARRDGATAGDSTTTGSCRERCRPRCRDDEILALGVCFRSNVVPAPTQLRKSPPLPLRFNRGERRPIVRVRRFVVDRLRETVRFASAAAPTLGDPLTVFPAHVRSGRDPRVSARLGERVRRWVRARRRIRLRRRAVRPHARSAIELRRSLRPVLQAVPTRR
jgi:hypothetical protein